MKWQDLSVSLTVAACVTTAAIAAAAPMDHGWQREFPISIEEMKSHQAERFAMIDEDGDGAITEAEFVAAQIDRPRRAHQMRGGFPRGERRGVNQEAVFDAADANADGQLSKEEFKALPAAGHAVAQQRRFARLDADDDGVLTADELMGNLEAMDANGDGQLTRDELRPRGRRPPGDDSGQ